MCVYRGMDLGTSKPTRGRAGPGTAPSDRPGRSGDRIHRLGVPAGRPDRSWPTSRPGAGTRCWWGGRGCTCGRSWTTCAFRAAIPMSSRPWSASSMTAVIDVVGLHDRLARLDPVGAERMEPTNRRRIVRALEVTIGSGQPFSSFGPGPRGVSALDGPDDRHRGGARRGGSPDRRSVSPSGWTPDCSTRCAALAGVARRHRADGPAGAGLPGAAGPRRGWEGPGRLRGGSGAPDQDAGPPPGQLVPAGPADRLGRHRGVDLDGAAGSGPGGARPAPVTCENGVVQLMHLHQARRGGQRLPGRPRPRRQPPPERGPDPPALSTGTGASAPTG